MSAMFRRATVSGVALVLGAASLAACGSSNNSPSTNPSSSKSSGGSVTAACKLTSPPMSTAKAPSVGNNGKASGKVGVILPDTTSSTRYTLYDAPLLTQYLKAAGVTPDVQNAGGSTQRFAAIAQSMIGNGVKVLIIDSIDASSGAAVEKVAQQAGVKVIDYDRVNLGGTAPYYVSFDNEEVGRLQAQTLIDCLNNQGITKPSIIMTDGGTDVDNNAVLFKKGAHDILDPLVSAGKATIVNEEPVPGWDVTKAAGVFQQMLTAAGGTVQGVVAANDDIANAAIGVLKSTGLNGHVVITGQDSGVEGLQNIINGQQSMTIFKNVKLEAQAAAALAIALIQGKTPAQAGLTVAKFADPKSASHNLQALLLPPQVITQANIKDVTNTGILTVAQVCQNITAACQTLGLS